MVKSSQKECEESDHCDAAMRVTTFERARNRKYCRTGYEKPSLLFNARDRENAAAADRYAIAVVVAMEIQKA